MLEHDQTPEGKTETPEGGNSTKVVLGDTKDGPWVEAYRSPDVHWDPLRAVHGLPPGSVIILEVNMKTGVLRVKG